MNVQLARFGILALIAIVAGVTVGQYSSRRRKLTHVKLSAWRERRITCIALLVMAWYMAPEILRQGGGLVAAVLGH